jgi:hypothetical protein
MLSDFVLFNKSWQFLHCVKIKCNQNLLQNCVFLCMVCEISLNWHIQDEMFDDNFIDCPTHLL